MPEIKICEHVIGFGDDKGVNTCTFRCQLPEGHSGAHVETGDLYGSGYQVFWLDPDTDKLNQAEEEA